MFTVLRIAILVSKDGYLLARIPKELIATTYLHEIGNNVKNGLPK